MLIRTMYDLGYLVKFHKLQIIFGLYILFFMNLGTSVRGEVDSHNGQVVEGEVVNGPRSQGSG